MYVKILFHCIITIHVQGNVVVVLSEGLAQGETSARSDTALANGSRVLVANSEHSYRFSLVANCRASFADNIHIITIHHHTTVCERGAREG